MIKVRFWKSAVYQNLPTLDQKMGGMREAKSHECPTIYGYPFSAKENDLSDVADQIETSTFSTRMPFWQRTAMNSHSPKTLALV
jgi:hypothetical protein